MIELLVSSAILVTAFLGATAVAQKSLQVSRQAAHTAEASFLLEEGAEAVRIFRDNAWTNISSLDASTTYYPVYSSGTWSLNTTPASTGIFNRGITVSDVYRDGSNNIAASGTLDSNIKLFTITVSWQEGGSTISKSLSFYLANLFS